MKTKEQIRTRLMEWIGEQKEKGIRIENLAVRLGYSSSAISKWKAGTRFPPLRVIKVMQSKFGGKIL